MEHHRRARAFLHCSSTAVYKPDGHRIFDEEAPLGGNRGCRLPAAYSICSSPGRHGPVGRRRFEFPTTIARLSVPYGDDGRSPAIHLHMILNG